MTDLREYERYALLSVSDKDGLIPLAQALSAAGVGLLSTGGTAQALRDVQLDVTDVATYTDAQEMMEGRVKTLHPKIHGGILGRAGTDDAVMQERDISYIDFVVVNLYPFAATVARPDVSFNDAIENIDIGGPTMVRAGAKNHARVAVVTDPSDYDRVIASLDATTDAQAALRFDLAVKAYEHTARYDGAVANWLGQRTEGASHNAPAHFPRTMNTQHELGFVTRYGENPHQQGAFYREHAPETGTIGASTFLQGKELSYNNVMDADAALACARSFDASVCVIVKHMNPCGVAQGDTPLAAYDRAYQTDPTSAFGGIIAFNRPLNAQTAEAITSRQFVEVIIAPEVAPDALPILAKFPNVRVLACGAMQEGVSHSVSRSVSGGLLVQDDDAVTVSREDLKIVTKVQPTDAQIDDLLFADHVAKYVKSNAIVYCKDGATIGVGAGQMSRVYSAKIAGIKAADEGLVVKGSVMASDAFFPFRDGIDAAAEAGIAAIIQPGGSKNDSEVIAAADEHGIAMVLTGMRHFRH